MNLPDSTKEKLIHAIISAAIIPGGFIILGGLIIFNSFYKELKKEGKEKDATKTNNR